MRKLNFIRREIYSTGFIDRIIRIDINDKQKWQKLSEILKKNLGNEYYSLFLDEFTPDPKMWLESLSYMRESFWNNYARKKINLLPDYSPHSKYNDLTFICDEPNKRLIAEFKS